MMSGGKLVLGPANKKGGQRIIMPKPTSGACTCTSPCIQWNYTVDSEMDVIKLVMLLCGFILTGFCFLRRHSRGNHSPAVTWSRSATGCHGYELRDDDAEHCYERLDAQ